MSATASRDGATLAALRQRIDPADPVALTNFAWLAARAGRQSEALDAARTAAAGPGAPRAAWRALERLAIGRTDGLLLATAGTETISTGPDSSPLAAAVAAHRQAAHAVAEVCYQAATGDPRWAASAWNGLGVLHEQRGERGAADAAWQRSLESPRVPSIHNRALAWLRRDSPRAGRELLGTHAELVANSAPLLFLLGYLALLDDDASLARMSIERALSIDPEMARAQFTLGLVHEQLGRPDDALVATRRGLLLSPWYLPQVWLIESSPEAVPVEIPVSQQGGESGAEVEQVLLTLGRSLLETGHLGEALAVFDQVLLRHPVHTAALFHRGVVLAKLRRYNEALADWDVVVESDSDGDLAAATRRHARSARELAQLFGSG